MKDIETVLIVDDEPVILEKVSQLVKAIQLNTVTASNGREAFEHLSLTPKKFSCVVTDVSMPEMNGLELIKATRAIGVDIPFIFYSAHGNEKIINEVSKFGVFDFIEKPSLKNLEQTIINGLNFSFRGRTQEDIASFEEECLDLLKNLDDKII